MVVSRAETRPQLFKRACFLDPPFDTYPISKKDAQKQKENIVIKRIEKVRKWYSGLGPAPSQGRPR